MQEKKNGSEKNILIKIFGLDKPGITSKLTELISKRNIPILDLGQSVTQGLLSLSILINVKENLNLEEIEKDFLFMARQLEVHLEFKEVDSIETEQNYKNTFIISSVKQSGISSTFLSELTNLCASENLNILTIENKSHHISLSNLDLKFGAPEDFIFENLKQKVMNLSHEHQVDMAIVKDDVFRFNKRLIVFDMDSTLIQCEVIEEIARLAGSHQKVKAITDRAMNGKLDFNESLFERVGTLKGVTKNQLTELIKEIPLTDGIPEFIKTVKSLGFKIAVISGGFTFFAEHFKNTLGLDYAFANELEFDDNDFLTGKVKGEVVNAERKATLLTLLTQQEGISPAQVVAIGDGANDLPMLSKAGMGIAFHAKDIVKKSADHHMSFGPMTSILSFLGIPPNYKL